MSYLEQARALLHSRELQATSSPNSPVHQVPADEKNEENEKSRARLTPKEAEALKAEITAVATAESSLFDRTSYDRLMARWIAYEAAGRLAIAVEVADPASNFN